MVYLAELPIEREMFQPNVIQKIETHFVLKELFPKNRAVYVIMWKNMVQRGTPQMAT